jgi:cysteine-rich repeat protein
MKWVLALCACASACTQQQPPPLQRLLVGLHNGAAAQTAFDVELRIADDVPRTDDAGATIVAHSGPEALVAGLVVGAGRRTEVVSQQTSFADEAAGTTLSFVVRALTLGVENEADLDISYDPSAQLLLSYSVDEVSGAASFAAENLAAGQCGDGVVDLSEGCDDGANSSGDGCDATCQVE